MVEVSCQLCNQPKGLIKVTDVVRSNGIKKVYKLIYRAPETYLVVEGYILIRYASYSMQSLTYVEIQ